MPVLPITPTSKIDAVNAMLRAIGESPVSSLSGALGVDVATSLQTLDEIIRAVLIEGWQFNTEYDFPLPKDGMGHVKVPANALSCDLKKQSFSGIDPVLRGQKVYDRAGHTYVFKQDLKAKIVFGLPFEELPESARYYITYRACRKLQQTQTGSQVLNSYNERDELQARIVMLNENSDDEDLNMLRNTPEFAHLR